MSELVSFGLQRPLRRRFPPPALFLDVFSPMLPSPVKGSPFGPIIAMSDIGVPARGSTNS